MTGMTAIGNVLRGNRLRPFIWGTAAVLLLLPAVAMQLGNTGVNWTAEDFIAMGIMLTVACGLYELGAWLSGNIAYRAGFGMAALTAFLTVWVNVAVGMLGDEGGRANLMFVGVLFIAAAGALVAALKPLGMSRAMFAAALAQLVAAGVGAGDGLPGPGSHTDGVLRAAVDSVRRVVPARGARNDGERFNAMTSMRSSDMPSNRMPSDGMTSNNKSSGVGIQGSGLVVRPAGARRRRREPAAGASGSGAGLRACLARLPAAGERCAEGPVRGIDSDLRQSRPGDRRGDVHPGGERPWRHDRLTLSSPRTVTLARCALPTTAPHAPPPAPAFPCTAACGCGWRTCWPRSGRWLPGSTRRRSLAGCPRRGR